MKIISLNVNDFGGCSEHLEEYKNKFGLQSGIRKWDELEKEENIHKIFDFLNENKPEVIIFQEFDINSMEAKKFIKEMKDIGYILKSEIPSKRPSMTVMFMKNTVIYKEIKTCHDKRNMRAYAIETGNYIIYGIHVPPKYDKVFWDETEKFWEINESKNIIMIGDLNTVNRYNTERLHRLLQKSVDVWSEKGNEDKLSVAGDYAIISINLDIASVSIKRDENTLKFTDHPAIILTLKQ